MILSSFLEKHGGIKISSIKMGVTSSIPKDDKALNLCKERKRHVKQILKKRTSLASAHASYIQSLKKIGTSIRKFVEPEANESSIYRTSINDTEGYSQLSDSSTSASHSPLEVTPSDKQLHIKYMKTGTSSVRTIKEILPPQETMTLISSKDTQPWDYFSHFHPVARQDSFTDEKEWSKKFNSVDEHELRRLREEEGIPDLEDDEQKEVESISLERTVFVDSENERAVFVDSENEVSDETSTASFLSSETQSGIQIPSISVSTQDKIEEEEEQYVPDAPSSILGYVTSHLNKIDVQHDELPNRDIEDVNNSYRENNVSMENIRVPPMEDISIKQLKTDGKGSRKQDFSGNEKRENIEVSANENAKISAENVGTMRLSDRQSVYSVKAHPKSFLMSIKELEHLFTQASEYGIEVYRMLGVHKLVVGPMNPRIKDRRQISKLLRSFSFSSFSYDLGGSSQEITSDPQEHLTRRKITSLTSFPSKIQDDLSSKEDMEIVHSNTFPTFCMNSGSHANTLEKLYAWETKLYEEVKAGGFIREEFERRCKILRSLEFTAENSYMIEKSRAVIKDLYSRMQVSIQRIKEISQKIEELRDKELQPQLEELIEGLARMWHNMHQIHNVQRNVIMLAYIDERSSMLVSEFHRQAAHHLEQELNLFCSTFMRYIDAKKSYVESINTWMLKCVRPARTKKFYQQRKTSVISPPIFIICSNWLHMFSSLPTKGITEASKTLTGEISSFLPRRNNKSIKRLSSSLSRENWRYSLSFSLRNTGSVSENGTLQTNGGVGIPWILNFDGLNSGLLIFLEWLEQFSEISIKRYEKLRQSIAEAKSDYNTHIPSTVTV